MQPGLHECDELELHWHMPDAGSLQDMRVPSNAELVLHCGPVLCCCRDATCCEILRISEQGSRTEMD